MKIAVIGGKVIDVNEEMKASHKKEIIEGLDAFKKIIFEQLEEDGFEEAGTPVLMLHCAAEALASLAQEINPIEPEHKKNVDQYVKILTNKFKSKLKKQKIFD